MKKICSFILFAVLFLLFSIPVEAAGALHAAYLAGYPDGTIRAEAALTRAQLAVVLLRLAEVVPEQADTALPDMPPEHWAHGAAVLVCEMEVMNLQPDGLFHPEEAVTGPELACTLNRLSMHEEAAAVWPSLKAGWEAEEISFAAGNGWVMGFDGETFDADRPLRRAELAVILNGLLGRTPSSLDDLQLGMPVFDDNRDAQAWYFLPVQEAAVTHTAAETGAHERWTGLG